MAGFNENKTNHDLKQNLEWDSALDIDTYV